MAFGVDVPDRLLADVAPGEPAEDLFGSRPGVGEHGYECPIAELVELGADLLYLCGQEDARLSLPFVARLPHRRGGDVLDHFSLIANEMIDCTILIALATVAGPTPARSSSSRNRVSRSSGAAPTPVAR